MEIYIILDWRTKYLLHFSLFYNKQKKQSSFRNYVALLAKINKLKFEYSIYLDADLFTGEIHTPKTSIFLEQSIK